MTKDKNNEEKSAQNTTFDVDNTAQENPADLSEEEIAAENDEAQDFSLI